MRKTILSALFSLLWAASASAGFFDDETCANTAVRSVLVPVNGISRVVIESGAGFLKVDGKDGATQVGVKGVACTSDKDMLADLQVKTVRHGNDLRIETIIPSKVVFFGFYEAKIDLEITLPPNVAVVIEDGSGSIEVQNVGPLTIDDGSGSISVARARGPVSIDDGSGSINIIDVAGDVRLTDGSGSISVAKAGGTVRVDADGSGSISIEQVRRDVLIDDDGSGSVSVAAVGGNFVVNDKGSGSISYDRVTGKVTIPKNKR